MDMTATLNVFPQERIFTCHDGVKLAAQCYSGNGGSSNSSSTKVLMLHGWMDNCRTFWRLAPGLQDVVGEIVALDLVGHGRSSHKSTDGPMVVLADQLCYIADVMQQLEWNTTTILFVGHSMGAALAAMYAATFPEHVHRLVLIEGGMPLPKPSNRVTECMRRHIEKRLKYDATRVPKPYPNLDAAVDARLFTVSSFPGNQTLSRDAAHQLVSRATKTNNNNNDNVSFVHDARLQWSSLLFFTPDQVEAILHGVQCPVLVVLGETGIPMDARTTKVIKEVLRPTKLITLPGSHHLHADPETSNAVIDEVKQFLLLDHQG